jgi:hypothetical protein
MEAKYLLVAAQLILAISSGAYTRDVSSRCQEGPSGGATHVASWDRSTSFLPNHDDPTPPTIFCGQLPFLET